MVPRTVYFVLGILALGFVDGATGYCLFPGRWFPPSSFAIAILGLFLIFWCTDWIRTAVHIGARLYCRWRLSA